MDCYNAMIAYGTIVKEQDANKLLNWFPDLLEQQCIQSEPEWWLDSFSRKKLIEENDELLPQQQCQLEISNNKGSNNENYCCIYVQGSNYSIGIKHGYFVQCFGAAFKIVEEYKKKIHFAVEQIRKYDNLESFKFHWLHCLWGPGTDSTLIADKHSQMMNLSTLPDHMPKEVKKIYYNNTSSTTMLHPESHLSSSSSDDEDDVQQLHYNNDRSSSSSLSPIHHLPLSMDNEEDSFFFDDDDDDYYKQQQDINDSGNESIKMLIREENQKKRKLSNIYDTGDEDNNEKTVQSNNNIYHCYGDNIAHISDDDSDCFIVEHASFLDHDPNCLKKNKKRKMEQIVIDLTDDDDDDSNSRINNNNDDD